MLVKTGDVKKNVTKINVDILNLIKLEWHYTNVKTIIFISSSE